MMKTKKKVEKKTVKRKVEKKVKRKYTRRKGVEANIDRELSGVIDATHATLEFGSGDTGISLTIAEKLRAAENARNAAELSLHLERQKYSNQLVEWIEDRNHWDEQRDEWRKDGEKWAAEKKELQEKLQDIRTRINGILL